MNTASASPDASDSAADLLPVRMLNEYAYCPRLFHLMHVEGRWADNVYTVEGRTVHRRVDRLDHALPDAGEGAADDGETTARRGRGGKGGKGRDDGDEPPAVARSVPLGSQRLGLTAKLDLVSTAGAEAVPVETKRGRVPDNPERSWEPERVQLMAQGLLLREHGYACDHGVLYFHGSRTRVDIPFTPELEARTLQLIDAARRAARSTTLPDPLDDSPKCPGCSLNAICLPGETLALREVPPDPVAPEVRRLYPPRDDAQPLYVQEPGSRVGKSKETLTVTKGGEQLATARLKDVSQLVLCGGVSVTQQALHLLCEASIPVVHLSMGGWFYGITFGMGLRNAYDRAAQFDAATRPDRCLALARDLVLAKGQNARTLLRRNGKPSDAALRDTDDLLARVEGAASIETLLGLEGMLAKLYFADFSTMLKGRSLPTQWDFEGRNRRPPKDPVNALLSFAYAMLAKECTVALLSEGLDPWWGLYHQPRHGRPSLALDLMEPLRPLVADSAVLTAINTGMVSGSDFDTTAAGCVMRDGGRKGLIRAYESRLQTLVTHPLFDYRLSWRAAIRVQARLLARWLRGDVPRYTSIVTR